jgi:hypothetical protein
MKLVAKLFTTAAFLKIYARYCGKRSSRFGCLAYMEIISVQVMLSHQIRERRTLSDCEHPWIYTYDSVGARDSTALPVFLRRDGLPTVPLRGYGCGFFVRSQS